MSESIISTTILLSILLPTTLYALIAFIGSKQSKQKNKLLDFLYNSGESSSSDFSKSTVAYMLQVYVTFYFIF